jgi:predicted HicB family RNase H-like nuclease
MSKPTYSFNVAWSDEDEAFVATCPEFEGLSAFGSTQLAALKEAQVALKLMIETYQEKGWPLPEPAKVCEYSGQYRQRFAKQTHARLARQAAEQGLSLNSWVMCLVERNSAIFETQKASIEHLKGLVNQLVNSRGGLKQRAPTAASGPVHPLKGNSWQGAKSN